MSKKAPGMHMPTASDVIYSLKTFLAASIGLAIGFSQHLENPYWSALTCYVLVNPRGAGAIRSKALFRFCGTLTGATIILLLTSLFGDQLGVLATAYVMVMTVFGYLYHIDRTPMNYFYFNTCVTMAIAGLSHLQQPADMFDFTTVRAVEICIGLLVMTVVDSLILPEKQMPGFVKAIGDWRNKARDWLVHSLDHPADEGDDEAQRRELRGKLRELVAGISTIDGKAVQMRFDAVQRPPRGRQLDLLREEVTQLVGDLAALELWLRPLRGDAELHVAVGGEAEVVGAWFRDAPALGDARSEAHLDEGESLAARLEVARDGLGGSDERRALLAQGVLSRMASAVRHWSDLTRAMDAIEDRRALPSRLEEVARRARPVRSVDYLASALDLAPLVMSLTFTLAFWYFTGWSSGPSALLFAALGPIFLVGQPVGKAGGGLLLGLFLAFALTFIYLFGILPRVTTYEMLILVLACGLIPVGILMTQNMLGLVISTMSLSFMGLQDAYQANLEQSLQTLIASAIGLMIGAICLTLGSYNQAALTSRRLAKAVREDIHDLARSPKLPTRRRFLSLALYRLSLYFPAAEKVADGAPPPRLGLLLDLSLGSNLLSLRRNEATASADTRGIIQSIREAVAAYVRGSAPSASASERLHELVRGSTGRLDASDPVEQRALRDALLGLDLALGEEAPHAA